MKLTSAQWAELCVCGHTRQAHADGALVCAAADPRLCHCTAFQLQSEIRIAVALERIAAALEDANRLKRGSW